MKKYKSDKMAEFIKWAWSESQYSFEFDAAAIGDKLQELNLLRSEAYSIKDHGTSMRDVWDAEEGEPIYFLDLEES